MFRNLTLTVSLFALAGCTCPRPVQRVPQTVAAPCPPVGAPVVMPALPGSAPVSLPAPSQLPASTPVPGGSVTPEPAAPF